MVEVGGTDGVRMQLDAAEVDDPGEAGRIVDDDLFGGPAGREREHDGAQPGRPFRGRALLVEGFAFGAVHETFEDDGTVLNAGQRAGRDGQIVANQVEFGDLRL